VVVTVETLRQIAANSTKKNYIAPIPEGEIGGRLFDAGCRFDDCRTSAQQQGYRMAANQAYRLNQLGWDETDEATYRRSKRG
jgi:hypothetical protein